MVGDNTGEHRAQRRTKAAPEDVAHSSQGVVRGTPSDFSNEPDVTMLVQTVQMAGLEKACLCTVVAPFDRIKYIMQCQGELQRVGVLDHPLCSSWHCFGRIRSAEGICRLWRGNVTQVCSLFPVTAAHVLIGGPVQTGVYNNFPRSFPSGQTVATYTSIFCGALTVSMVSYPLEFARFRLAVDLKRGSGGSYDYRHSLAFFSQPLFSEAPQLLYAGFGLYLAGSVIYGLVHAGLTQQVFLRLPYESEGYTATAKQVGAGLGVSAVSTLGLHPLDTMRRRMMIAVTRDDLRYNSVWHCFRHVLATEGVVGFYRGAAFTLLRMVFISSLYLWVLPAA